jgi:protein-S-isoprenylcysteine O-methyltransferase Ste14
MSPPGIGLRVAWPPPLLFVLALVAGLAGERLRPATLGLAELGPRLVAGGLCFATAAGLATWAFATLRRLGTSPEFGGEVTALAEAGPYRFTRNPLYLALVLALAGFACMLDSVAVATTVPALLVALDRLVVVREERFLAARFGARYEAWARRVRRWI